MSRFELRDIDPPTSLAVNRPLLDHDPSHPMYSGSPVGLAVPRAYDVQGIQDKEYTGVCPGVDTLPTIVNRHTVASSNIPFQQHVSSNHHRPSSLPTGVASPVHTPSLAHYTTPPEAGRGDLLYRQVIHPANNHQLLSDMTSPFGAHNFNIDLLRSTLWWGGLESWMDEEYAKQVCNLMGWSPDHIQVPSGGVDATGQQANNPGYCFLTFPSPSAAASVISQVNKDGSQPITMPNSTKPLLLNWASAIPEPLMTSALPAPGTMPPSSQLQRKKEYSIFVGDLAPETSNSDLVAVFRNPLLGLRNDREPKLIQPFLSCHSAKIMLDPVTGVSRGYGFVRWV